ncbi:MAG: flavin reductase [Fibrobacteria bacterium]|nr:flavin reductase [Fibrobacteria bacterium]
MAIKEIDINQFCTKSVDIWLKKWFLLTAGTMEHSNTMTIAWGSFGGMWKRPFAQIAVRPVRHTFGFLNSSDSFSICAFPEEHRKDMALLGSKSGRDGDKLSETGLTLSPSTNIKAPCFKEAELIIECKTMYWQDMEPKNFQDQGIDALYPEKDYHRIYFGEILAIQGTEEYSAE